MKKLLYKEMKLSANPLSYWFIAFSVMTMIPRYPILVGSFFICLGIFYTYQQIREYDDMKRMEKWHPPERHRKYSSENKRIKINELPAIAVQYSATNLRTHADALPMPARHFAILLSPFRRFFTVISGVCPGTPDWDGKD